MKITREIAQLDWREFGKMIGICFCQNCGHISQQGKIDICPKCGLLNQYIKGGNNERHQTTHVCRPTNCRHNG